MPEHSARDVERVLRRHGYVLIRQSGSHRIYRHPELGRTTMVPFHGKGGSIKPGTFSAILRQTQLSKETFEK